MNESSGPVGRPLVENAVLKIGSPGMPSSEIVSRWVASVMLICSVAVPLSVIPQFWRKSRSVANAATPQNWMSLRPPVSSTKCAAPEAMLPSLMTVIVPDASRSKRSFVLPSGRTRLPTSSETLPRISKIGSSPVKPSPSRRMPPEISMKKTLLGDGADGVGEVSASVTMNDSLPAVPVLPATSAHEPSLNVTVTPPFTKVPVR